MQSFCVVWGIYDLKWSLTQLFTHILFNIVEIIKGGGLQHLFMHAEKTTSTALQETQILSMHQVSAVQSISLSGAAAVAIVPPHQRMNSFCYSIKSAGKVHWEWFSFISNHSFHFKFTHLFWSRSCCSGAKDSETSAEMLSGFDLDCKCRQAAALLGSRVSPVPPCGHMRALHWSP